MDSTRHHAPLIDMPLSLYQLKPRFQDLLRPFVSWLYRLGVTANQVTVCACAVSLAAPIRGSHGNAAAMAFDVKLNYQGASMTIRVIDVMTFDANGKFTSMKAYWGPSDMIK